MTIRVGINGFGRIGRNFWRAANAADGDRGIEIVAANDLGDIATMAHLLKYDTVLGTLADDVSVSGDPIGVPPSEAGSQPSDRRPGPRRRPRAALAHRARRSGFRRRSPKLSSRQLCRLARR